MRRPDPRAARSSSAVEPVEELQTVALRLVADVVGQAGEAVDRQKVVPDRTREKAQRHRKILGARLSQYRFGAG